jgi:hypothetical protein
MGESMAFADQSFVGGVRTLWRRVNERRLWRWILFTVSGSVAIATWLWYPLAGPYVRIASSSLSLTTRTDCLPIEVDVTLVTTYAELRRARLNLVVRETHGPRSVSDYSLTLRPAGSGERTQKVATLSDEDRTLAANSAVKVRGGEWMATLDFSQLPSVDIRAIHISYATAPVAASCAKESLTGARLFDRLVGTSARLMHFSLMQDKLSDIVFAVNEVIGNVLLCALLLAVLWLAHRLAVGWRLVYWVPDEALAIAIPPSTSPPALEAKALTKEQVHVDFRSTVLQLSFLRVIGPATGFLLTVSSLIAGLHPSATAAQDTFRFVSSLQLALVATLLGLTMRVLAEFAIRLHRDAAERKLKLIEAEESTRS